MGGTERKKNSHRGLCTAPKGKDQKQSHKEQDLNESKELWEQRGITTINTAEVNGSLQFSEDSGSSYVRANPDNREKKIKPPNSQSQRLLVLKYK